MIAAGAPRPEIPSAQEIAPLIGGGNVIANASSDAESRDFECTYELARNPDGSRSMNNASLSVTHYGDPAKAKSVFDGYVKSSVESTLDRPSIGSIPILRLEQGSTYTAFSDASVARVIHGTTLVTLAVVNMSRPLTEARSISSGPIKSAVWLFAPQAPHQNPMPRSVLRRGYPKTLTIGWPGIFWTTSSGPQRIPLLFILGLGIPFFLSALE